MKRVIKNILKTPKFLVGLTIFLLTFLLSFYYMFSSFDAMELVGSGFHEPGTYYNVTDVINTEGEVLNYEGGTNIDKLLPAEDRESMKEWLISFGGVAEADIDVNDAAGLLNIWTEKYDSSNPQKGLLAAEKRAYTRMDQRIRGLLENPEVIIAQRSDEGVLEEKEVISPNEFVWDGDVGNKVTLPLGTDNFGADMLTKLSSAVSVSLRIGFIAGLIATMIGIVLGLTAGYMGGIIDNFITFITNIFTVIPSFIILILIANSIGQAARGPEVVAIIIGLTSWPWTCRSVRSQVISLRNREHVNLSKLSGHSMPKIIVRDILPYVASYVVMALILQISSGILAEAQLSMLGLGPSTSNVTTLGLMMQWATKFSAHTLGAWWAFVPVILAITFISFSLNLMNTGLDQVFNPQLRDN